MIRFFRNLKDAFSFDRRQYKMGAKFVRHLFYTVCIVSIISLLLAMSLCAGAFVGGFGAPDIEVLRYMAKMLSAAMIFGGLGLCGIFVATLLYPRM